MLITRTPLRMSYVGGGTDIRAFYREEPGAVLSTSIDKYIYITCHKRFGEGFRLAYSRTEEVEKLDEIEHPLVREALKMLELSDGVEVTSTADIPASGSGLGSSSSYTVGLLNVLAGYLGKSFSAFELAQLACEIEIERCGQPIGKQDQFAAAIGGMNLIEFLPNDDVVVSPVRVDPGFSALLNASTLIFFTGTTRAASTVLEEQTKNSQNLEKRLLLRRMAELAHRFKSGLEDQNMPELAELLLENWSLKKQLARGITNARIEEMYQAGMRAGAWAGKILGAGSGGFMLFLAPADRHLEISAALAGYRRCYFQTETTGTRVIYHG